MATDAQTAQLLFEVQESQADPGDWTVEAIDHESEGECYVTIFAGTNAEARAREYAAWKNLHPAGRNGGLNEADTPR